MVLPSKDPTRRAKRNLLRILRDAKSEVGSGKKYDKNFAIIGCSIISGSGASAPARHFTETFKAFMNQHADFRTYVPLTNGWDQYRQGYAGRSLRQLVETEKVHEAVPKVPLVVIETCLHNDLGQNLTPAERRGYLDFLANYFQGRGSMTVFMSSNPRGYGTDPFVNGNGHTWMDLFEDEKAFCELKGYEYIDQYTPWESERVRRGYDRTKMYLVVNGQPDLIHPDDEGYDIMATTLKRAICGVEYGYGNPY